MKTKISNKENVKPKLKSILKNSKGNLYKKKIKNKDEKNEKNLNKKKYVRFFLYPEVIYFDSNKKKKNYKSCCANSCYIF